MLTQHNRKTARLSPDYTFTIRELEVWSGDETKRRGYNMKLVYSRSRVNCYNTYWSFAAD